MNRDINICYIDDGHDPLLSEYMVTSFKYEKVVGNVKYDEYTFATTDDYRKLFRESRVRNANIIIIDSKLFEYEKADSKKFTGEKFKVLMKQVNPFIKTVVISQNPTSEGFSSLEKCKVSSGGVETAIEYYEEKLKPVLAFFVDEIYSDRETLEELSLDDSVDTLFVETIERTMKGLESYSEFEKNKLDELVKIFQEVKDSYGCD